jgi:transcriptional regulator with XRE-family HTH domain
MKKETSTKEDTLKSLIESAGYTQKEFAKNLNLNLSTVTFYIAGEKLPRVDRFLQMCKILNVSPITLAKSMGLNVDGVPKK